MAINKKDGREYQFKVKPGDKKPEENDAKDRYKDILKDHPEVLFNAKNLFHNENGKTIPEESVPRGDAKKEDEIYPRNQWDITDEDVRSLINKASHEIDEILFKYDPEVAYNDALERVIYAGGDGKYQGKINASTFALILSEIKKKFEGKKLKKSNDETINVGEISQEDPIMYKELIAEEIKATQEKLSALSILADQEGIEFDAAETFKCPTCGTKVLKKIGYCVKCKKKVKEAGIESVTSSEEKNKESSEEHSDRDVISEVTASLDEVAQVLEYQNDPELLKLAFEIDKISDSLEGKIAVTLEGDKDEPYMESNFKAGFREGDKDEERYMKEFNTDNSVELEEKITKKQFGKDASESLPYQVKK